MRFARCSCLNPDKIVPSDIPNLAFFEYRGEGSRFALETCGNCMFGFAAHVSKAAGKSRMNPRICDNFIEHGPHEFDSYYCGHSGWD